MTRSSLVVGNVEWNWHFTHSRGDVDNRVMASRGEYNNRYTQSITNCKNHGVAHWSKEIPLFQELRCFFCYQVLSIKKFLILIYVAQPLIDNQLPDFHHNISNVHVVVNSMIYQKVWFPPLNILTLTTYGKGNGRKKKQSPSPSTGCS